MGGLRAEGVESAGVVEGGERGFGEADELGGGLVFVERFRLPQTLEAVQESRCQYLSMVIASETLRGTHIFSRP